MCFLGGVVVVAAAAAAVVQPYQTYVEGPAGRMMQHRADEIDRLVSWASIAPPFGAGADANGTPQAILADDDDANGGVFWDAWHFSLCDDACTIHEKIINTTVFQGAPGRVSRGGLPLPVVQAVPEGHHTVRVDRKGSVDGGDGSRDAGALLKPFVIVTQFPEPAGALMVTALGRTLLDGWHEPLATVSVDASASQKWLQWGNGSGTSVSASASSLPPIALVGRFGTVEIKLPASVFEGIKKVLGADLADVSDVHDITSQVELDSVRGCLIVPGSVIDTVGTLAKTSPASAASPGLLVQFE